MCTLLCGVCDTMLCVLFAVLLGNLWYVYCSPLLVSTHGICTIRCFHCEIMVCVLFAVLCATLRYVYFSFVECDQMLCVLFDVICFTVLFVILAVLILIVWYVYFSMCCL